MSGEPYIGATVHYTSYGTPGDEYVKECRAAVVTEVAAERKHLDKPIVGLAVLNPSGLFFDRTCEYDDGAETPGSPDCPSPEMHGNPFHYCPCGWVEGSHAGGTWHWPERTE